MSTNAILRAAVVSLAALSVAFAQDPGSDVGGGAGIFRPKNPETPITSCFRDFVPASTKTTLLGFRLVRNG